MVARALYIQAGGAEPQLSSITADKQIVRLLEFITVPFCLSPLNSSVTPEEYFRT